MSNNQVWDDEYDVVVVGSGAAAMAGAYSAASRGLKALLVEKTDLLGGASAYAGASCWLPGTQVQQRAEVEDSTESAKAYLASVMGDHEIERREAFVDTAPELVAFFERDPAIEFYWTAFPDYFTGPESKPLGRSMMPVDLPREEIGDLAEMVRPVVEYDRYNQPHPDGPLTAGQALIGRLLLALTNTGNGTIRLETELTELITEDGRVTGVIVKDAEGTRRIRAAEGVILGAGGFEANQDWRTENQSPGSAEWTMAPAGANVGTGILAGQKAGGAVEMLNEAWWCPGAVQPRGNTAFALGFRGGVWLDSNGQRFANECLPYDQMGRVLAAAPERIPSWFIFDSRFGGELPGIMRPYNTSPQEHLEAGTWVKADTLEELAQATELPVDALKASIERFNGFTVTGVDEDFHRGENPYDQFFADPAYGPGPTLIAVDQPPYYAARMVLSDLGTKGGLRTDVDARVLREDGTPVPGLYAVGNTSASFSGGFYPGPGTPLGSGMVFAYRAAQTLKAPLKAQIG
ncbi:FAD-dependent oxidoreductase [Paeniglutamicibacter gangotriensis]|uniref:3-oxosteroid 1-dehydrogenase n=1 Tax=Paeniglutamicibacter gangotriensis Lz1y TaxID=1276920 RepID=M7MZ30_9MICC|nr:FAD-dependent oxidoreductase [Paeniglutamicibacter gangotriensis]EMR00206.1 tricarballylate dehydrogenase [Paeniglutamicibacter gangotriensis Lz1y]